MLIKGGEALETAYRLSAVVFDKTGTLTMGQPAVDQFAVSYDSGGGGGKREERVLIDEYDAYIHTQVLGSFDWARTIWMVASAERGSEHPLAKCIVR